MNHIDRENLTMTKMVGIYCRAHHGTGGELCDDCAQFLDYAQVRLEKCPYGEDKPTCANCPVHCYKPRFRDRAKAIMRFSGPRMFLRHPLLTIAHLIDGRRRARHPRELTREERLERNGRVSSRQDGD
ncbi:MAG: nitrous oxide-stimulated promoter family protein [Xanthomonadales bacterium]|nr:nitrous oxide-stimulated promoter family protein [Xanthomonadales bacterium]